MFGYVLKPPSVMFAFRENGMSGLNKGGVMRNHSNGILTRKQAIAQGISVRGTCHNKWFLMLNGWFWKGITSYNLVKFRWVVGVFILFTLPKTNIAPKNGCLVQMILSFWGKRLFFRGETLVSGSVMFTLGDVIELE